MFEESRSFTEKIEMLLEFSVDELFHWVGYLYSDEEVNSISYDQLLENIKEANSERRSFIERYNRHYSHGDPIDPLDEVMMSLKNNYPDHSQRDRISTQLKKWTTLSNKFLFFEDGLTILKIDAIYKIVIDSKRNGKLRINCILKTGEEIYLQATIF